MFDLRYYRRDLIAGAQAAWQGVQSVALVSCHGDRQNRNVHEPRRGRAEMGVLVLVHRDYLIGQPIARLGAAGYPHSVAVEKAGDHDDRISKILFASVQSIGPKSQAAKLAGIDPNDFGLVIVDEGHRGTAATYRTVLDHFRKNRSCKVLILTATPNRKDGARPQDHLR